MPSSAARSLRFFAPAFLAGALGGSCLAETTATADAVVAQCAQPFADAIALEQSLDAVPGLTRVPQARFDPCGEHGLFITPMNAALLTPALPDRLFAPDTPSALGRGFSVGAFQGQNPYTHDAPLPGRSNGFPMVTMPLPPGTPIAEFAEIGGMMTYRQSIPNRSLE